MFESCDKAVTLDISECLLGFESKTLQFILNTLPARSFSPKISKKVFNQGNSA